MRRKQYKRTTDLPKGFYKTPTGFLYYVDAQGCEFNVRGKTGTWYYQNYDDIDVTAEIERELPAYLEQEGK